MKHIFSAWVLLVLLGSHGMLAAAQAPVARPDTFALPINLLVLRMSEGNGFDYVQNPSGSLVYENLYLVDDGVVHDDILSPTRDWYEDHDIQDIYLAYVRLSPEGTTNDSSGLAVQIRLATLPDAEAAARLVPDTLVQMFLQQFDGPSFAQDVISMQDVPLHDQAIIGVTGTDRYYGVISGDPAEFRAPFVRFIAQQGTMVASIKVTSLDPSFNDAVARELLSAQLECLREDQFCVPVPVPAGIPYDPMAPFTRSP